MSVEENRPVTGVVVSPDEVTVDPSAEHARRATDVVKRVEPAGGQIKGAPVYGAEHCPLLVDDEDVDKRTVVSQNLNAEGAVSSVTVHRYPDHVIVDPVKCPSCGIVRERHGLVFNNLTGIRDCAIAINEHARKEYAGQFGANAKAVVDEQIASRDNTVHAADQRPLPASRSGEIAGENLSDAAKTHASALVDSGSPVNQDQKAHELATLRSAQGK